MPTAHGILQEVQVLLPALPDIHRMPLARSILQGLHMLASDSSSCCQLALAIRGP